MGRPRKPTKLKILHGNPGKRRLNPAEPMPDPALPSCPPHLEGEAVAEWGRITAELFPLGLLTLVDRTALACYCQAYARWVEAEAELKARGAVLVSEETGNYYRNPWYEVANKSMDQMHKFLIEFGMTPASRSRVSVKTKTDKSKWEGLLA